MDHLVNQGILSKARFVKVINDDGSHAGEMTTVNALKLADDRGLDLVLVAPDDKPPICKILDYGKYKYNQNQKHKNKQSTAQPKQKELRLRACTSSHDVERLIMQACEFLKDGHEVMFSILFKGRDMVVQGPQAQQLMTSISINPEIQSHSRTIVKSPKIDGKRLTMLITPK